MQSASKILVWLLIGLGGSLVLGFFGRGAFDQVMFTLCVIGLLGIGLLSAICGLLWGLMRGNSPSATTKSFCAFSFGAICCLFLALYIGQVFQRRDVRVAKAYPAKVAPLLEKYRRKHGTYPKNLAQLPNKPPVPRLQPFYWSEGQSYEIEFLDPGQLGFNRWHYDSATQKWEFIFD